MSEAKRIIFRTGEKVILRPVERSDVPKLTQWINDEAITRHLIVALPMSHEDEAEWVQSTANNKPDNVTLMIETGTGTPIGNIGLHNISAKDRTALLGIVIGEREYHGNGYGTDAVRTMLHYAFYTLNLRKVNLAVYSSNPRAKRCYEKCGFVQEGVRREQLYIRGRYEDEIHMAIFKRDFAPDADE